MKAFLVKYNMLSRSNVQLRSSEFPRSACQMTVFPGLGLGSSYECSSKVWRYL